MGREVCDAIERIGGDLPGAIAPAEHIKTVAKWVKSAALKLALDELDVVGLLGQPRRRGR